MAILAKNINGMIVAAHNQITAPNYTLVVADYALYDLPFEGWDYYVDEEAAHAAHNLGWPGSAYTVNDELTLSNAAIITVDDIGPNGEIVLFTVVTPGTSVAVDQLLTATGGTGTGYTLLVTAENMESLGTGI